MKTKIHTVKIFISGMITMAIIFSLVTGVAAAVRTIQATLIYRDIKIEIDGSEIMPKDANGVIVEPFIMGGTTYLPVRAIGDALGMDVGWDDITSTVRLISGQPDGAAQNPQTLPTAQEQAPATPPASARVFESGFVNENRPLDPNWQADPITGVSFAGAVGESGLTIGRGTTLTLIGFSIEDANNFMIEFEAKGGSGGSFILSLGTDEENNWINTFRLDLYGRLFFGSSHIADFGNIMIRWNSIKFEISNKEVLVYIDGQLITLVPQKLDNVAKQQLRFENHAIFSYDINNFKITIND